MPEVTYGGRDGETFRFEVDPELLAVRTRHRRSLRTGPVLAPEARFVAGMDVVLAFPEACVEVYRRRQPSARTVEEAIAGLRDSPATRFAGHVLVDVESGEPVLYTENVFVTFGADVPEGRCREILRSEGLAVRYRPSYAVNGWFTAAAEGTGQEVFAIAQRLLQRDDVELAHPEIVRAVGRRAIAPQQWHLEATTVDGRWVDADANVAAAHAVTRGEGVTIAVIDTGIDIDHQEFAGPGKIAAPRDVTNGDADPRPARSGEEHGTACAGVACADGRAGASGVAPGARLMPIRLVSGLGSQAEAAAFGWAAEQGADVVSCSWGPVDGAWFDPSDPRHRARTPLPDQTRLAIDFAATRGRGGLGCVVLFAAGNGNESVDLDGYASHDTVLAVAASNDRDVRSVYSDMGDAVFCAFPSNDFAYPAQGRPAPLTPGIWTTDITGRGGYNPGGGTGAGDPAGNYTDSFGGTSSSCPGAAGVAALVLAVAPGLRREEVADVLRRSCERVDPQNGRWDASGHSPWYGYGRLDAGAAVTLAQGRGAMTGSPPAHPGTPAS